MRIDDSLLAAIETARAGRESFLCYVFETPEGQWSFMRRLSYLVTRLCAETSKEKMNKSEIGFKLIKAKWQDANDVEREQILLELKNSGLSIVEAVMALRSSEFFPPGEAKKFISASP